MLISAFENNEGVIPVKLIVKEFSDGRNNKLHVAITLPTIDKVGIARIGQNINSTDILPPTLSEYNLSNILEMVKKDLANDKNMGKYIPWQFGYGSEIEKIDSDYEDALRIGDMKKAKDMVDKAARLSGYNIEAYHGTRYSFTEFLKDEQGKNTGTEISKIGFLQQTKKQLTHIIHMES